MGVPGLCVSNVGFGWGCGIDDPTSQASLPPWHVHASRRITRNINAVMPI